MTIFSQGQVLVRQGEAQILQAFLDATPIHPQIRTPDIPAPENNQPKVVNNEVYQSNFNPTQGKNIVTI